MVVGVSPNTSRQAYSTDWAQLRRSGGCRNTLRARSFIRLQLLDLGRDHPVGSELVCPRTPRVLPAVDQPLALLFDQSFSVPQYVVCPTAACRQVGALPAERTPLAVELYPDYPTRCDDFSSSVALGSFSVVTFFHCSSSSSFAACSRNSGAAHFCTSKSFLM